MRKHLEAAPEALRAPSSFHVALQSHFPTGPVHAQKAELIGPHLRHVVRFAPGSRCQRRKHRAGYIPSLLPPRRSLLLSQALPWLLLPEFCESLSLVPHWAQDAKYIPLLLVIRHCAAHDEFVHLVFSFLQILCSYQVDCPISLVPGPA